MARFIADYWRLPATALTLVADLGLGAGPPRARAQGAEAERVYYSRQTAFLIPFQMDPGANAQQVLLHVSEDLGKTYQHVATAAPTDKSFRFQARRDGWYWFTVQTQTQDGRYYPPNVNQVQPGLKVCVDTQPPVVVL
jgi:hypothetical protein